MIKQYFKKIQVFLVTGGMTEVYRPSRDWRGREIPGGQKYRREHLASTEVYRPSAGEWRMVPGGALPRRMAYMRVVTLNNRLFLFGEEIILAG